MAAKKRQNAIVARWNARGFFSIDGLEPRWLLSNPSVSTVTPPAGATGVALNQPITVSVNLPNGALNANTVIGANVTLYPTGDTSNNAADVPAVVNTSGGGDDIVLTPSVNLAQSTNYTFSISSAVQDVNGDPFTAYSETFTTGNTAPTVDQTVAFSKTTLPTTQGVPFTDMQMFNGDLWASTETGLIYQYPINADGTLGVPAVYNSLQTHYGGKRLITGFAFDPNSTPSNPILWVSNTFYALSGATNGQNFTGSLTVMQGAGLASVTDAIVDLPRSISDHVNDQPVFQPNTDNLFFCQAGQNAYGAPDTTWGNRPETELSAAILEVNTNLLNLSGPALNVLTPDAKSDAGVSLGGTYNPFAPGAPLTIYADGVRNAFTLMFDSTGALWAPANGSSSGGNTPGYTAGASGQIDGDRLDGSPYNGPNVPALTDVAQTEDDILIKVQQGAYYGHPDPERGEFVLGYGNPTNVPANIVGTGLVFTAYPSGTNPDPAYQPPNFIFGQHNSPDGMIQYTDPSSPLNGDFLVTEYSAGDDIVALTPDASDNIEGGLVDSSGTGPNRTITGFTGFDNPVSLTEDDANGYIYVSELGGTKLTLLKPESVAPQATASPSVLAFNGITAGYSGAAASPAESVTITNTGADALTFGSGAFSIVNAPGTTNAADYTITNASGEPTSLAPGQSFAVKITYTSSATGIQAALLQVVSNANPTLDVQLNGIGTPGQMGYDEPSLVQVLRANGIPTIVGYGPNDVDVNTFTSTSTYPESPDSSSQEVAMQRLVVANAEEPVTITPLASFDSTTPSPAVRFGYYAPGDPSDATELFTIAGANAQSVYPTALGATSFDPGTSPFGLYAAFPGTTTPGFTGLDIHYSEDALNTLDPSNPRKFRFFPLENPNGSVVPNAYIVAAEDYNSSTYNSFVNFVGIIRNVEPAPNATAGSTPSVATGANPPVMGVVLNDVTPGSTNLIFNTINITNPIGADVVHNTNTITINNTGNQALTINSLVLSDPTDWALVSPPAAGASIAAGASLTVTIKFIATTDPSHTTNETNDIATTVPGVSSIQGGGVWTGTLTINSNDPVNPTATVKLAGYWQDETEHEMEPNVATISNLLMGYTISDTGSIATQGTEFPNNGNTVINYGSEVDPSTDQGLLVAADSSQPVTMLEAASFHQQYATPKAQVGTDQLDITAISESGTTVTVTVGVADGFSTGQSVIITSVNPSGYNGTYSITGTPSSTSFTYTDTANLGMVTPLVTSPQSGWYPSGGSIHFLWRDDDNNGQSILPNVMKDSYSTVMTSFTPTGAFGLDLDGEKSQDSANATVDDPYNTSGHALRFWPVVDANGNTVPNTYLVGMDYRNYSGPNSDYQDLLMIVSNVTFEAMPATPTDLQASIGSTGVQLQWAPVSGATGYDVYREAAGGSFALITSSPVTTASYIDSSAPAGSNYKYEVMAVNSSSVQSVPADASIALSGTITAPAPTAPAAPTNVAGDGSSGTQVNLTWAPSATATSYNVLRMGPADTSFVTIATGDTVTNLTDTAVIPGDTYYYEVVAVNSAGSSAPAPSPAVVVAIPQPPATPVIMTADGSSGTEVVLSWASAAYATTYDVLREGPTDSSFIQVASGLTGTIYNDTAVTPGSTYQYEVEGQNAAGTSAPSAPLSAIVSATPPSAPQTPTGFIANGSNGVDVALSWNLSMGATGYTVEREGPGQTNFVPIATDLALPMYTDNSITVGASYLYEVDASNSGGASAFTAPLPVTIPPPPPATPTNVAATASSGSVTITWTAVSGAASYTVDRQGPGDNTFLQVASGLTSPSYTDTSVTAGSSYSYEVSAVNSTGSSAFSSTATAMLPAPPATLDVTVGKGASKLVRFTAANGAVTTILVRGAGTATVDLSAATISQSVTKAGTFVTGTGISVSSITTAGTTGASVLSIVSKGGAGSIALGTITVGPLNSLQAANESLVGSLAVAGSIGKILLGSANAVSISATGTIGTLQIRTATSVQVNSAGAIGTLSANSWTSTAAIKAPAIKTIKIAGNASFVLAGGTIHSLKVGGTLSDSAITLTTASAMDLAAFSAGAVADSSISSAGNLGAISAGSLLNSQIEAGLGTLPENEILPTATSQFDHASSIASVTLKKKGPSADINSVIAAESIKNLVLGTIQFSNGGTPFGVAAVDINSITGVDPTTGKTFAFKKLSSEAIVTADLTAKAVAPEDFVLRIV